MAVYHCARCGEELTSGVVLAFEREPPGRRVVVVCTVGHRNAFVEPLPGAAEEESEGDGPRD